MTTHRLKQQSSRTRNAATIAGTHGGILVPLDGSPQALAVIPVARAATRLLQAEVRLIHGAATPLSPEALLAATGLRRDELTGLILDQAVGDPAGAIAGEAAAHHTRLIVMSTHGWSSEAEKPLGHVTEALLREAPPSVMLVSPSASERAAQRNYALSRILVPLDGTPTAASALKSVELLAARCGARLDVLFVIDPSRPPVLEPGTLQAPCYLDHPEYEWRAWSAEFAARFCPQITQTPDQVLVVAGEPGVEIARVARDHDTDLIVLGWKGRLAPGRAQTVRTVIRQAPCPLLLLRVPAPPLLPEEGAAP